MRRVLVVDDDPKVCETLDRYLAHAGYSTASALDGARALELARLALGDDFDGLDRTIDAHIKNLRRKVGAETIATVFGIGYKVVA